MGESKKCCMLVLVLLVFIVAIGLPFCINIEELSKYNGYVSMVSTIILTLGAILGVNSFIVEYKSKKILDAKYRVFSLLCELDWAWRRCYDYVKEAHESYGVGCLFEHHKEYKNGIEHGCEDEEDIISVNKFDKILEKYKRLFSNVEILLEELHNYMYLRFYFTKDEKFGVEVGLLYEALGQYDFELQESCEWLQSINKCNDNFKIAIEKIKQHESFKGVA